MNKKKTAIIILALVLVMALFVLTSCAQNKVNYTEYSEDDLNFMGKIVKAMHEWIGNYGWTVVVFTVALKVLMLPLDIWQRYSARKNALKMQQLQPIIESIDKRYANDQQRANEEKQKLFKKYGYSAGSMCLPLIITMTVFFFMFGGLTSYSNYSAVMSYKALHNQYETAYVESIDSSLKQEYDTIYSQKLEEYEQDEVKARTAALTEFATAHQTENRTYRETALATIPAFYEENVAEPWLWINSVWQPDTWAPIMKTANEFKQTVQLPDNEVLDYDAIRQQVLTVHDGWNGYMILPILSVGLSFLSIWISQKMDNRGKNGKSDADGQQAASNKTMMVVMPLMMAYFGFIYTGAFAIYMVMNYVMTILSTVATRGIIENKVQKYFAEHSIDERSGKASYMR